VANLEEGLTTLKRLDPEGLADWLQDYTLSQVGSTPPEEINDGDQTHPSARLEKHIPSYRRAKKRVGAPAAADIGLPILREKCPHFGQWLTSLEKLSQQT
jgi:hypothetical protein